ncbi:MAG: hypothetical protein JO202_06420 [Ktedonobacteraceae bacterium]|nr:hypothetical protein [Ktedonobacteraceae bacterium]
MPKKTITSLALLLFIVCSCGAGASPTSAAPIAQPDHREHDSAVQCHKH